MEDKENLLVGACSPQNSPSTQPLGPKKYQTPNDSPQSRISVKKQNFSPKKNYSPKNQATMAATPKPNRPHHVQLYKESLSSPFKDSNSPRKLASPVASPKRVPMSPSNCSPCPVPSGSPSRFALNAHSPVNRVTLLSPSLSPLAWQSKLQSPKFLAENEHPLSSKLSDAEKQEQANAAPSVEVTAKQKMWESIVEDWSEWSSNANKNKLRSLIVLQVHG